MTTIRTVATRAALVAALAAALGACASQRMSSQTVSRDEVGAIGRSVSGVIIDERQVTIGGTRSGAGTAVGAIAGGAIGAQFGGGTDDRILAGILGATAGALIGDAVEEGATQQQGIEYAIRLDNGDVIYVVQPADRILRRGQRVDVVYGSGRRVRVVPRY